MNTDLIPILLWYSECQTLLVLRNIFPSFITSHFIKSYIKKFLASTRLQKQVILHCSNSQPFYSIDQYVKVKGYRSNFNTKFDDRTTAILKDYTKEIIENKDIVIKQIELMRDPSLLKPYFIDDLDRDRLVSYVFVNPKRFPTPYECLYCKAWFYSNKTTNEVVKHMYSHHTNSDVFKYLKRDYNERSNLDKFHVTAELGSPIFKCDVCPSFTTKKYMEIVSHVSTNTDIKLQFKHVFKNSPLPEIDYSKVSFTFVYSDCYGGKVKCNCGKMFRDLRSCILHYVYKDLNYYAS